MVGGVWQDAATGATFPVEDPSTGKVLAHVADAAPADSLAALHAAHEAQGEWAAWPPRARSEILRRAYDRLIDEADTFARVIAQEMGKSLQDARGEVLYAAEFLRWFSEEAVRIQGRYQLAPNGKLQHLISKKPVGPCLLVTPWNFPLAMITRKVGPAVAAGCTMVLKPAELTPLTAGMFVSLMHDVGLPPGVLNLITTTHSSEVVGALLKDNKLKKISFTGSTRVGKILLVGAAENVLRISMELGGNAPFIVFEDADVGAAVEGAVQAKLRNIGQACTAANRFYVHATLVEEFTEKLRQRFAALPIGRGTIEGDIIGPLISAVARENVHKLVLDAVGRGARLVQGGAVIDGAGYFYPPTILVNVPADARVMQEEIFGPVAPICGFSSEQEVIAHANASEYGLAAYVYTSDLDRAMRIKSEIDTGMLGINAGVISDPAAPFGGVKLSGIGREGGAEGIEEYLTTQYVGIGNLA
ncbi:NAD-dependent succinate-semialdehyde dehydrogenase [Kordiimonas pumila]|uniref:NAD-dependent succinate-semialdehyde dehydrogenase n=1 Tax=Kordiimonas pumila TaxID=2161677 RepID=A0ABV7DAC6_9PROT